MALSMMSRVGLSLLMVSPRARAMKGYDPDSGAPYGGAPVEIPGVIQPEEYDLGGPGVGYYDTTPGNRRGAFRPKDDVDIFALESGYSISHVAPGEFLRFTVDVTETVEAFAFSFSMASTTNVGSFRIVAGGGGCDDYTTDLSGLVRVPARDDYKGHEVSGKGTGGLRRGLHFIWMCTISNFFDIDSFTMSDASPSVTPVAEPTPAPLSTPPPPLGEGGPFSGVPIVLPGLIEAEEFDLGGEGVAYSDTTTGNMKGGFRPDEDVDISPMPSGGYNVGFIEAGEFLRYTVNVTKKIDNCYFSFKVASDGGYGSFRIVSGGTGCEDYKRDISGLVQVPATGGNVQYVDLEVSGHGDGGIRAHVTQIWLCVESQAFNIDSFSMSKFSTWDPTPEVYVSVGDAFDNSPNLVPGTIQAEYFDTGGEGKGYSDSTPGNEKGAFRPNEDVDINEFDDGGYVVGYVAPGEYLRYTVEVLKKIDDVIFTFRVASADGLGSFRVVSGGNGCDDYTTDLSGVVKVPATGGSNRYMDLPVSGKGTGGLRAHPSHVWLCVLTQAFNIDYFTMSKATTKPYP